jgi:transposase
MVAAIGTGDTFTKGRDFAWLGLVPKQFPTAPHVLGKISKRGNRYLRVLFVQAAWVVLIRSKNWERRAQTLIEAARGGCTARWRSRLPTSGAHRMGVLAMAATSRRARLLRRPPRRLIVQRKTGPR